MPDIARLQTNFSSGELDPTMRGRVDTGAYQNGASKLLNIALLNTGGATRRPGTKYLSTFATTNTRVLPFDYDESARFLIALQDGYIKVCALDGSVVATIAAPWTESILWEITYAQQADTIVLCHKTFAPRILKRVTNSSWTLSTFVFETTALGDKVYQPYDNFSSAGTYVVPSGNSGGITITSSTPCFSSAHVGVRMKLYGKEVLVTAYTSSTQVSATCQASLEGHFITNPFKTISGGTTMEVAHIAHGLTSGSTISINGASGITTQTLSAGGVNSVLVITAAQINGSWSISVIDDDSYSFTHGGGTALSSSDGGGANAKFSVAGLRCFEWLEATFSPVRGYPRAVCFHDQRLWFGGSTTKPDSLWSSQISRFFNFDVGEGGDNESIQVTIGSDLGSSVRHMVSNRHLQIFTGSKEFFCPPPVNSTITPGTFRITAQTAYGSSFVRPQNFDGATLYGQANGKTIREYIYGEGEQAYGSTSISLLSSHLISTPTDLAVLRGTSKRGEQYALFINTDGTLAVFMSSRAEKVAGWTPWATRTGDAFSSICNIANVLYFVVKRNGNYLLEQFEADDSQTLDSATIYASGSPTATWTVGARFFSQTVSVISGNFYLGEFAIGAAGELNLGTYLVSSVTVGFNYSVLVRTLPPYLDSLRGQLHGKLTRIIEALVLFDSTYSVSVEGKRLTLRQVTDPVESAPDYASTYYRWTLRGYSRQPYVEVTQEEPLPLRLLALRTKVVV